MPIIVVCPGCRKSFKVSEKFAGKSGACPKCKHPIKVPTAAEEVKVHAPAEFAEGGRGVEGKLALKPIERVETKLTPVRAVLMVGSALLVLLVTWAGGKAGVFRNPLVDAGGLLLLSPVLVLAAYTFLRDDELEPYGGVALYIRAGLCALVYAILWGVIAYLDNKGVLTSELYTWIFVASPILVAGSLTALASLDLDFGSSVFHFAFYMLITIVLRWIAHIEWAWQTGSRQ
jgi:hypothetical protein